jgi:hypothetical protein
MLAGGGISFAGKSTMVRKAAKASTVLRRVSLSPALDRRIAAVARQRRETRTAVIRLACERYLAGADDGERSRLEGAYIEGYRRLPEAENRSRAFARLAAAVVRRGLDLLLIDIDAELTVVWVRLGLVGEV